MKLTKWLPILIAAAIAWTILVLMCAKVFGHDTVKIRDGKEVHDAEWERESNDRRGNDSHWHFGEVQSGAWDRCIADSYDEENHEYRPEMCDEEQSSEPDPPPPPPPSTTSTTSQGQSTSTPSSTSTPTTTTRSTTRRPSSTRSTPASIELELQETVERPPSQREPSEIVDAPLPEPLPEPVVLEDMTYTFYEGWNLANFPVVAKGTHTFATMYEAWGLLHIVAEINHHFFSYSGEPPFGSLTLYKHASFFVYVDEDIAIDVRGVRRTNASRLNTLTPGINLIGFPSIPDWLHRPSDLLDIPGICTVVVTQEGELRLIGRVGDPGDEIVVEGQGFAVIASEDVVIWLDESVPSAPSAIRERTLTTSWGAMKREHR